MPQLKLAIITDLHLGPDQRLKLGSRSASILEDFRALCDAERPDLVVDLGDLIANTSRTEDLARIGECAAIYRTFAHPVEHIVGNHDEINGLTCADWEQAFDAPFRSRFRDDVKAGFRIVFFSPTYYHGDKTIVPGAPIALLESEIDFLRQALDTQRTCVVCTHAPLHRALWERGPYWGKVYDNDHTYVSDWAPAKAVQRLLRESPACVVLSGHHHWDALAVQDDIAFIQVNSATDASMTWPQPSRRMGLLTIDDTRLIWDARGEAPHRYELPRRQGNRQWKMNWAETD